MKDKTPEQNPFFTGSTSLRSTGLNNKIQHFVEVFLGYIFIHFPYRFLGKIYVRIIAYLIKIIGPLSWAHKRITDNLQLALPELSPNERAKIARNSWGNIAYIPYDFINAKYKPHTLKIEIKGIEHLNNLKENHKNGLFFSGHNACWEIIRIALNQQNINSAIIYRPFNNTYFDHYARNLMNHGFASIFQKNPQGIRKMIHHLRSDNGHILMLTDQRLSSGLSIPFFNQPAMTTPSAAELAVKYKMPLIPIFVTRTNIGTYKIIVSPAIKKENKTIPQIVTQMNDHIEAHIRQYPTEWFWLHRRWR